MNRRGGLDIVRQKKQTSQALREMSLFSRHRLDGEVGRCVQKQEDEVGKAESCMGADSSRECKVSMGCSGKESGRESYKQFGL